MSGYLMDTVSMLFAFNLTILDKFFDVLRYKSLFLVIFLLPFVAGFVLSVGLVIKNAATFRNPSYVNPSFGFHDIRNNVISPSERFLNPEKLKRDYSTNSFAHPKEYSLITVDGVQYIVPYIKHSKSEKISNKRNKRKEI